MNYLLTKEDKKVSITKTDSGWNYKKEFGSTIIENFEFVEDKLAGFIVELKDIGYKVVEEPSEKCVDEKDFHGCLCKIWYKNDLYHRDNGPAVEYSEGWKYWFKEGVHHRDDGPAIEEYLFKAWIINGKLHKEDGPAVEYTDGDKEWWVNGVLKKKNYKTINGLPKMKCLLEKCKDYNNGLK